MHIDVQFIQNIKENFCNQLIIKIKKGHILEVLSLLGNVYLFANLTTEELKAISKICHDDHFNQGDVIFQESTVGDKFYIITTGSVRIAKQIPGIGQEALAVLHVGDYFGEMALMNNLPRSASAIAHENVSVLTIDKTDFNRLLFSNRDIAYKLLWVFCRTLSSRLRETNEKLKGIFAMVGQY